MASPAPSAEVLKAARDRLRAEIEKQQSPAKFVRLALHDALTYSADSKTGGANGTIRKPEELQHRGNEQLQDAADVVSNVKKSSPLSFADLVQLAGALALEASGGPAVPFVAGRRDSRVHPPEGRLPTFEKSRAKPQHFWDSMRRTGLTDRQALALLGSHPFGSSWSDAAAAEAQGPVTFSNDFFGQMLDSPAAEFPGSLLVSQEVRRIAEIYRDNMDLYVEDYAEAIQQASELGMTFTAPRPPSPSSSQELYTAGQVAVAVIAVGAAVAALWWYKRRRPLRP